MRSTFQAWKNSCATVPSSGRSAWARAAGAVSTVLLRCSMPSPFGALGVGGEEGVVPGLEGRQLAVDGARLAHDLLDAGGEAVGFGLGAVVAQGDADRRLRRAGAAALTPTWNVRSICGPNCTGLSSR